MPLLWLPIHTENLVMSKNPRRANLSPEQEVLKKFLKGKRPVPNKKVPSIEGIQQQTKDKIKDIKQRYKYK